MGTTGADKENVKPNNTSRSRQRSASKKSLSRTTTTMNDSSVNVSKVSKAKLKNIKDKRNNQRLARLEKVCLNFSLTFYIDVSRPVRDGAQK